MFSKRRPRSCVENSLWLAKRGNRERREEVSTSVGSRVDGVGGVCIGGERLSDLGCL